MESTILHRGDVARVAKDFSAMAVRECGYNLCLDICRTADMLSQDNEVAGRLRAKSMDIPDFLAKGVLKRPGRSSIQNLKAAYVSARQVTTLLMLCHDLNYIETDRFLRLNSEVNIFCDKLRRFINFQRKRSVRQKR